MGLSKRCIMRALSLWEQCGRLSLSFSLTVYPPLSLSLCLSNGCLGVNPRSEGVLDASGVGWVGTDHIFVFKSNAALFRKGCGINFPFFNYYFYK